MGETVFSREEHANCLAHIKWAALKTHMQVTLYGWKVIFRNIHSGRAGRSILKGLERRTRREKCNFINLRETGRQTQTDLPSYPQQSNSDMKELFQKQNLDSTVLS